MTTVPHVNILIVVDGQPWLNVYSICLFVCLLFIWHQSCTKNKDIQTSQYNKLQTPKSQNAGITHKVLKAPKHRRKKTRQKKNLGKRGK